MAKNIPLIVFPVKHLDKAKIFYNAFLGTEPYVDGGYYVGYKLDDQEVGLDPNGKAVVSYIDVDDIEVSLKNLKEVGAEVVMDSKDVGGGLLIAQVKDDDGNVVGFRQQPK
jgi:predicted enzyme related to lactoylglutathione lyase